MYQNVKRTCRVLFLLIKPIVLWRSRCRCRPRCLSSLYIPERRLIKISHGLVFARFTHTRHHGLSVVLIVRI